MPLGLDPSIILGGRAPQIENPVEAMQNVLRLRTLQQQAAMLPLQQQHIQSQIGYQNAETAKLESDVQKQKDDAADQQAFHEGIIQSGGDPAKMRELGPKLIKNPTTLSNFLNHASEVEQRTATIKSKQHEQFAKDASRFADRVQGVLDAADPETQASLWRQAATDVNNLKDENGKPLLDQQLDPNTLPNPNAIASLQQFAEGSALYNDRQAKIKSAEETRQTKADDARKREVEGRQRDRAEAHNTFLGGVSDQATYATWRAALPDSIRNEYPTKYNGTTTPDLVRNKGRSVAQQDTADKEPKVDPDALARTSVIGKRPGATPQEKAAGVEADATLARIEQHANAKRPVPDDDPLGVMGGKGKPIRSTGGVVVRVDDGTPNGKFATFPDQTAVDRFTAAGGVLK